VEATVIGEFTDSGRCVVDFKGRRIVDLDLDFLHNGVPQLVLRSAYEPPEIPEPVFPEPEKAAGILKRMLGRLNLCSKEYVVRQFDHEVLGGSVLKPLLGRFQDVAGDAAVVRPLLDSRQGLALSHGVHPGYGDIDPYWMAACSIDTAIRNVVTVGADPARVSLLDNFCWCSSHAPDRLGQLKRAARACYDFAVAFGAPFISGKDSMFNDFQGYDEEDRPVKISVPPTLLVSSLGVVDDVLRCVTPDLKSPGERLYLLGITRDELGGSEYYALLGELAGGARWIGRQVPRVDAGLNLRLYTAFHQAVGLGLVSAAAGLGAGGLAFALARMALAGNLGAEIDLAAVPADPANLRSDRVLYSESQGRILVSVEEGREPQFAELFRELPCAPVGRALETGVLRILSCAGGLLLEAGLEDLRLAYKETLWW